MSAGAAVAQHFEWSVAGGIVETDVAEGLGDAVMVMGSPVGLVGTNAMALTMANLGVASALAADNPQWAKRILLQVGWDESPAVAAMLDAIGMVKEPIGWRAISVEDFNVVRQNMILNLSSAGHSPTLVQTPSSIGSYTIPTTTAPGAASVYAFDADVVAKSTSVGEIAGGTLGPGIQKMSLMGPSTGFDTTSNAMWHVKTMPGGKPNINLLTFIPVGSPEGKAGLAVRQLAHLADRFELDPTLKTLVIEEAALHNIPTLIRQSLVDYGAALNTMGGMYIHNGDLLIWRDTMLGPLLNPPLPYLAPGSLPQALDYLAVQLVPPTFLVDPSGTRRLLNAGTSTTFDVIDEGATLAVGGTIPPTEGIATDAFTRAVLADFRWFGDYMLNQSDITRVFIDRPGTPIDIRAALLHRGGVVKAERIVMTRQQFLDFANEIGVVTAIPAPVPAVAAEVSTGPYTIEAWKGLDAVATSTVVKADTAYNRAETYILDKGADRIYVFNLQGKIVAQYDQSGMWKHGVATDDGITAVWVDKGHWDAADIPGEVQPLPQPGEVVVTEPPAATVTPPEVKDWATAQEMVDDLTVRYSNADPKFAGAVTDFSDLLTLDFDLVKPVMQEVDRLMSRYGIVPSFRGVKAPKGPSGGMIAEIKRPNPNVPGSYMYLPADKWSKPEKIESLFKSEGKAWAVMGHAKTRDEWIKSTIAHEMGHEYMGLSLHSRFGLKGDPVRKDVDDWFADFQKTNVAGGAVGAISDYSTKNAHEMWAEAFAARQSARCSWMTRASSSCAAS